MRNYNLAPLGPGVGLRHEHLERIINEKPPFKWFEIICEDFLGFGGSARESLQEVAKFYPIIGHCVCMTLGSTDPLDFGYLAKLKELLNWLKVPWVSDHLCFTMVDHTNLNDLIPLPFTDEAIKNVTARIKTIQDFLELPMLVENVTRYITVSDREMQEAEFLGRVLEGANCGLLLDVTNVYLNSKFHGYDAFKFISSLPYNRIGQFHLAGWEAADDGTIIDSHDAPVPPEVWDLFRRTLTLTGPSSVLIEWDKNLPPMERLLLESDFAGQTLKEVLDWEPPGANLKLAAGV